MTIPRSELCVEHLHNHVGQCQRAGYANGYADGLAAAREVGDYYPTRDPRVEAAVTLMVEAVLAASRERYSDDFRAALEASAEAQTRAHHAIYDLAEALIRDGAQP